MSRTADTYSEVVHRLGLGGSTSEETYYPAIRDLLVALLRSRGLPFDVRTGTSEGRSGGGVDRPDVAFYDGAGDFVVLFGEVKLPSVDLAELAPSTDRNDQIGRYLAQTRAVLLCNIRSFGLLTVDPAWTDSGPVPPAHRRLELTTDLWPSEAELRAGTTPTQSAEASLAELLEQAITRFAPIAEPESLARILACQARRAKADLPAQFTQAVRGLLDDFGSALGITFSGEEGEEFFRSSLIQTAFYGVFAGWTLWRHSGSTQPFRWEDLADYLKIPFLGELFYEFRHPTRIRELRLAPHLDLATETLGRVSVDSFFAKFGTPHLGAADASLPGAPTTNAILYFYEPFLEAFDPTLRKELGVWYTPPEIVSYQVKRVDQLLRTELGCPRGFADERVVVLDPCCGTGAYLLEVLRLVARQLEAEGAGALLGAQLLDIFCRRVMGFEILTAPFVIAQLQLYLGLSELGATPAGGQRLAVFLTNALTGWDGTDQLKLNFPELQQEHDASRAVKRDARIIVILGNPPYNRFAGVPVREEADLVDHYKGIERDARGRQVGTSQLFARYGIQKHLLDDLYIRFFRLAEARIGERAEFGVVSFISNSSFYTGRSHPLMRESLLRSFQTVWVDSLNGDKYKTGKVVPEGLPGTGTSDQSVFSTEQDARGIQVGTGITTLVKRPRASTSVDEATSVYFRHFWGRADDKRRALGESLNMADWSAESRTAAAQTPAGPREYVAHVPSFETRWKFLPQASVGGYEDWPSLDELFPVRYQGVNPNRGLEGSLVETDRDRLADRMRQYFSDADFLEIARDHPVLVTPRARYAPELVRDRLQRTSQFVAARIVPYLVFPLDLRWIYYETNEKLLNERRPELWANAEGNEFLLAVPEPRKISEFLPALAASLFDLHFHDRGSVGFPAELNQPVSPSGLFHPAAEGPQPRQANLAPSVWGTLRDRWGLDGDLSSPAARGLARGLLRHALTVCHSPRYAADHKDSLAQDWARIPIPTSLDCFEQSRDLGNRLAILLDPQVDASAVLEAVLGTHAGQLAVVARTSGGAVQAADLTVTKRFAGAAAGAWQPRPVSGTESWLPVWGSETGDLFLNDNVCLRNVPERVWQFELGGYPVVKKWLGYREASRRNGAPLRLDEVSHLRSMIQRLAAVLALHEQLDETFERSCEGALTSEVLGL